MDKDRIEIIAKVAAAVGALIGGIAIPLVINMNAERNRQSQLYMQVMSQREQSDSALRERMFSALITSYFGSEISLDPEKQLMYLHLLSLNFQEFFDAKPLFEDLGTKLQGRSLARLRSIAQEVADKQINLLTRPENKPAELNLCADTTAGCSTTGSFKLRGKQRDYLFMVELLDVLPSEVHVRVSPSADEANIEKFEFESVEFELSYYDTPFMNNTRLLDGSRFALTLRNLDTRRKVAVLKVVTFPEEYMSLRDRPYFDEMLARVSNRERPGGD